MDNIDIGAELLKDEKHEIYQTPKIRVVSIADFLNMDFPHGKTYFLLFCRHRAS